MNLFTFSSKLRKKPLVRSLIITSFFLSIYHILTVAKLVLPSDGINQWQINFIKVQKYAYNKSSTLTTVLAGSSIIANIKASYISPKVINLGLSGGCAQTGIEAVLRNSLKPNILVVEINEYINRKIDNKMIDSIYNPVLYWTRLHIPMLRKEYQPVSILLQNISFIRHRLMNGSRPTNKPVDSRQPVNIEPKLTEKLIVQTLEVYKEPLSKKEEILYRQEAEYIKSQLSKIRKDGVRVVLVDIPIEQRIQNTVQEKQIRALMRELFPINDFEWLPEPPPRHWKTSDGIHLIESDAKDYGAFLNNQILSNSPAIERNFVD